MITSLDRLVFRRGLTTCILLCATVIVLFLGIDVLVRFSALTKAELEPDESRGHLFLIRCLTHIPFLLKAFLPFVMIGTVVATVLPMLRHRQLMLLAASGLGGKRVCAGLLALAGLVGLADAINRDLILPLTEPIRDQVEETLMGSRGNSLWWKMPESGTVWFARHARRSAETLDLSVVVGFAADGAIVSSDRLTISGERWTIAPPVRHIDATNHLATGEHLPADPAFALPADREELETLSTPRAFRWGPHLLTHGGAESRGIVYGRWLFLLAAPLAAMVAILSFARPSNRDAMTAAATRTILLASLPIIACSIADDLLTLRSGPPEIWAALIIAVITAPVAIAWWRLRV